MHTKILFDLENEGQGHEVQKSQWPIRWQMSTSIKVVIGHFRYLSPFSIYSHFEICDQKNMGHGDEAPLDGKCLTPYLMAIECLKISTVTCHNSHLNSFTLNIFVKVIEYNFRNGAIR